MLRSCGEAASSRDSLTTGRRRATSGSAASSAIVVSAPTRTTPPSGATPRSGRRVMSISTCGPSTPSFIRSTCVVPPARYAASGPVAAVATAWCTSVARRYSNARTVRLPRRRTARLPCRRTARLPCRRTARLPCRLTDRRDNVRVGAAPADIAAHELADLRVGARPALGQQRDGRQDLPRRAEPALEGVAGDKRPLHRVQGALRSQALDRRDVAVFAGHRQREAGQHPLAVREHGTG